MIYWLAMSRDFPDWIDVARAAQADRCYAGDARLSWMPRVVDLLDSPEEEQTISFEISASLDDQQVPRLAVHVHGSVPMTCQRSLKRYMQSIDSRSEIAPVASEAEAQALPEELEPKLVPDGRLRMVELVEDELLLALPLVPRDPASEPVGEVEDAADDHPESDATEAGGPFAALARLKKN